MKNTFFWRLCSCFIFNKEKRRNFRKKHLTKPKSLLDAIQQMEKQLNNLQTTVNSMINPRQLPQARGLERTIQLLGLEILKDIDRVCRKHNLKYWLDFGTLLGAIRHKGFIPWDNDVDISMPYEDYLRFQELAPMELENSVACFPPGQWCKVAHKAFSPQTEEDWLASYRVYTSKTSKIFVTIDVFPFHYLKSDWDREKTINYMKNECKAKYDLYVKMERECGRSYETWRKVYELSSPKEDVLISATPSEHMFMSMRWHGQYQKNFPPRVARTCDIFPLKEIEFEGNRFLAPRQPEMWMWCVYGNFWQTRIFPSHLKLQNKNLAELQKLMEHGKRLDCL